MKMILFPVALGAIWLTAAAPAEAQSATGRIVKAAGAFLRSLDEEQRKSAVFAFEDEEQRKRWSNFPIQMVPRAG